MYYNKTIKRLTKWNRQDLIEMENYIVNGEKIKGFKYQWPKLEEKISNLVNNSNNYCSVIHGDLCFSNILLSTRSFSFKLIDPRGSLEEEVFMETTVMILQNLDNHITVNTIT